MSTAIAIVPEQFIFAQDNELRTTSIKVAEAFGKLHKNVISKIESLECSKEFSGLNFKPVEYLDAKGEKRPMYEMTKDGFMFLVMGFTGKAAAAIKEAYINAFNLMHAQLFGKRDTAEPPTKLAYSGCLTLEQQDAVKSLVKERVEELPKEKQGGAAVRCWSSIKKKFGCGYKEVASDQFTSVVSLVARVPLDGELLPKPEPVSIIPAPVKDGRLLLEFSDFSLAKAEVLGPHDKVVNIDNLLEYMQKNSDEFLVVRRKDLQSIGIV